VIVPIIMGSKSDVGHARKIATALAAYGVATEIRVASAHKHPHYLFGLLEAYEANPQPKVYITIAGRSNALSGVVDANVTAPVIACPPPSEAFGGADVFSSLRMPSGVVPAVVLDPEGAALLAVKMLALVDPGLEQQVIAAQEQARARIEADDQELQGDK
jgi:phosphoribosylaminoimidazole carboxylase PurE protein